MSPADGHMCRLKTAHHSIIMPLMDHFFGISATLVETPA